MTYHVSSEPLVAPRLRFPDGKRLFDLGVVVITLPIWLPVLLCLVCVLFVAQGPGVFYLHDRLGRHGQLFRMIKLRTMVPDASTRLAVVVQDPDLAAEWARRAKLSVDPRITPLGAWLRRYSLDELPQVLNVLTGEMSLIGPRPVPLDEFQAHYFGDAAQAYLSMRPGLSGLWQVTARNSDYDRRLQIDAAYAAQHSVLTDLRILWRTFGAVVRGTGC